MKNRWHIIPALLMIVAALKWLPIEELFHLIRSVPAKPTYVGTELSVIEREGAKILLRSSRNADEENNGDIKYRKITVHELPQPKRLSENGINNNNDEMIKYLNENEN